jgi:hypothetical protein
MVPAWWTLSARPINYKRSGATPFLDKCAASHKGVLAVKDGKRTLSHLAGRQHINGRFFFPIHFEHGVEAVV